MQREVEELPVSAKDRIIGVGPAGKAGKAALVRATCDVLLEPIRTAARAKGYAIALHGSVARDIDLVAIPWTEEACSAHELVEAVAEAIRGATGGIGWMEGDPYQTLTGEKKPHGRRAWSIYVEGTYVDLSVMPRSSP